MAAFVPITCDILGDSIIGNMACLSPNGEYLAASSGPRFSVRKIKSPHEVFQVYQSIDKIEKLEFSPDSEYILCALYSRNAIQVFSLKDPEWKCRINESVAGVISAAWCPDSRTVLTESDFGIQLSLWSLVDSTNAVISLPKPSPGKGIKAQITAFSECNRFLAVVHRIEMQDMIGVYSLSPVSELNKFKTRSNDVVAVHWVPKDTHIVTLDSPLSYKVCVYRPSGELMIQFEAYQNALGIRQISMFNSLTPALVSDPNPHCSLMAIGSFDGSIRIMTLFSWLIVYTLPLVHCKEIESANKIDNLVTKVEVNPHEVLSQTTTTSSGFFNTRPSVKDSLFDPVSNDSFLGGNNNANISRGEPSGLLSSTSIHTVDIIGGSYIERNVKSLPKAPNDPRSGGSMKANSMPAMGVSNLSWSPNGEFLAATEDSTPRCLWIWKPLTAKLVDLIVQIDNISSLAWKPTTSESSEQLLAFCTGTSSLYFWSSSSGIMKLEDIFPDTKQPFSILSIRWSSSGEQLLCRGKENFCIAQIQILPSHPPEQISLSVISSK